jgi:hypothetical protein
MLFGIQFSSEQFNLVEGFFWIILSALGLCCYIKLGREFKRWSVFSAVVLFTFGISDFLQIIYGSFLQPHLLWLFIWKIIGVIGLVVSAVWYIFIRLRGN